MKNNYPIWPAIKKVWPPLIYNNIKMVAAAAKHTYL